MKCGMNLINSYYLLSEKFASVLKIVFCKVAKMKNTGFKFRFLNHEDAFNSDNF